MIINKYKAIIIFLIIVLAVFLRFWKLGSYPALNADEAAIGYNAYSLIETGKDEHGNFWPIHFQSFNDYKPGLYFYLVLPMVKFFGLNEWSVRIPNAFLGVLTVYLVYLFVQELLDKTKLNHLKEQAAIFSAFALSISPWHIHFSRGGWEVNSATFFILTGLFFLLKFVRNQRIIVLSLSALFFAMSLYTYHAARVITPLLCLGFVSFYRELLIQNIKKILLVALFALIITLPLAKDMIGGQVSSRALGVGLFADSGPLSRINEQRGEHQSYQGAVSKIYHNKLINYGLAFVANWASHYHGEFLFLSGDVIERNRVPETGQMYMLDLLFLVIGITVLIKNSSKKNAIVIWWLLIAPTAAALTFQSPHALRAQNMVIPLSICVGIGLAWIFYQFTSGANKHILLTGVFGLSIIATTLWGFLRYQHMYWVHMAKEYKYSSQYGVKELVETLSMIERSYPNYKVLITDRYDQPYILTLFYLKYPPKLFQNGHTLLGRDRFGFSTVPAFGKYEFKSINFDKDITNYKGYLIVGTDEEIPDASNVIARIYGSNGLLYFKIVAN